MTSLLIVDDSGSFRRSARRLLEDEGFEIVGEAHDGAGAVAEAARLQPALVVLDVQLGADDGFDVAEMLAMGNDPPAVVMISTRAAASYADRLAASSARGFIAKAELSAERLAALIE